MIYYEDNRGSLLFLCWRSLSIRSQHSPTCSRTEDLPGASFLGLEDNGLEDLHQL
jgi:hypothetical protein